MRELGIRPEHECFDSGHVANLDPLIDMGLLEEPLQISCVMGVTGGIRPTARNLAHMSEQIPGGPDGPNNWGVIGISREQWRLVAASLTLGGNVRVGLEDNFYLPDGTMARSNGDLDREGASDDRGRRPRAATVAEARELLGVPRASDAAGIAAHPSKRARADGGALATAQRKRPATATANRGAADEHTERSKASASSTSAASSPAASARCCSPTSAPRC